MAETSHIGKKITRIRELRGMKQETLAEVLGMSQQAISKLEQNETIDEVMLERVAKALGVTIPAVKNFNEDAVINNNIYDQNNTVINYQFNPLEKIVELYERLLKVEREKVELIQKLLDKK